MVKNKMTNKWEIKGIPIFGLIFAVIGFIMIILGLIIEKDIFNLAVVFGTISLLFTLHLFNAHSIEKLEETQND